MGEQAKIERRVASGELSAARTFTEMSQITQRLRARLAAIERQIQKWEAQLEKCEADPDLRPDPTLGAGVR